MGWLSRYMQFTLAIAWVNDGVAKPADGAAHLRAVMVVPGTSSYSLAILLVFAQSRCKLEQQYGIDAADGLVSR